MAGRPKGAENKDKPWREALRITAKEDPLRLRALAEKTFAMALEGDMQAIKEIGDRLDGKAPQQQIHTGDDGGALKIEIVRYGADDPPAG